MRLASLLALLLFAGSFSLLAQEPAPSPSPDPPAGSVKLKSTEGEAIDLGEPDEVGGKVQKPTLDVLILSDPVKPPLEPPTRRGPAPEPETP
jgi:hypothetical protein